jgi:hypothetical protein
MRVRTDINQALAADRATRVLLHDAGYLAFSHAMREGVDMVGLKTPRAMALHAAMTQPSCGQQRDQALQQLAAGTHPSHLVIWQPWDDLFQVTAALRTAGWRIDRLATIGAVEQVQVYRLAAPGK